MKQTNTTRRRTILGAVTRTTLGGPVGDLEATGFRIKGNLLG